jgi:hypothetical protein
MMSAHVDHFTIPPNGLWQVKMHLIALSSFWGEAQYTGQTYTIRWTCPPGITQVQIQYSWTDGADWSIVNFPSYVPASPGEYTWTIPTNNPYLISETGRIKVIDYGGSGKFGISARFSVR